MLLTPESRDVRECGMPLLLTPRSAKPRPASPLAGRIRSNGMRRTYG